MLIELAWQEDEKRADELLKAANKYLGALKSWKKACQVGHVANRQKALQQAEDNFNQMINPVSDASDSWKFDVAEYLSGDTWKQELISIGKEKYGLNIQEDDAGNLVSSPVVLRSQSGRNSILIGRQNWTQIRPSVVATELKRLKDRTSASNSSEFLESLFAAYQRLKTHESLHVKFQDIYDLFSITPGWKKENPLLVFGQAIYALHLSSLTTTRSGISFQMVYPTGTYKEKDVWNIISEDGRPIRYYGILFKIPEKGK